MMVALFRQYISKQKEELNKTEQRNLSYTVQDIFSQETSKAEEGQNMKSYNAVDFSESLPEANPT